MPSEAKAHPLVVPPSSKSTLVSHRDIFIALEMFGGCGIALDGVKLKVVANLRPEM